MQNITVKRTIKCVKELIIRDTVGLIRDYFRKNTDQIPIEGKKPACNVIINRITNYPGNPIDRLAEVGGETANRVNYLGLFQSHCYEKIGKVNVSTVVTEQCDSLMTSFKKITQNITIIPDSDISTPTINGTDDKAQWSPSIDFIGSPWFIVGLAVGGTILLGITAIYCRYSNRKSSPKSLEKLSQEHGFIVNYQKINTPLTGNYVFFQGTHIRWD